METENKELELKLETFNEKEFFAKEVLPKMKEVLELCRSRRIPVLMHAITAVEEDGHTASHISYIENRNGQAVFDLANIVEILKSNLNVAKSMMLSAMASAEKE